MKACFSAAGSPCRRAKEGSATVPPCPATARALRRIPSLEAGCPRPAAVTAKPSVPDSGKHQDRVTPAASASGRAAISAAFRDSGRHPDRGDAGSSLARDGRDQRSVPGGGRHLASVTPAASASGRAAISIRTAPRRQPPRPEGPRSASGRPTPAAGASGIAEISAGSRTAARVRAADCRQRPRQAADPGTATGCAPAPCCSCSR